MKRRSRRMSWGIVHGGSGGMGADSPDSTRNNQKECSRNCLCPLRAPSSTPLLIFVNVHCFCANTLSVCVIDKDGIFSSLKKCPLSSLQFWLSAMCLQVWACVCRPQKNAGEEEAKDLTMLQNAPQSGSKKFKALCPFVSHDPPLASFQMEVPVLPPKRGQGWHQMAPRSAGSAAGVCVWNQSSVHTKDPVNHHTSITD